MNLRATFFDFTDNIITRAEFRHQRFVINNSRSATGWIILALLLLAPAIIMSLVFLVMGLVGAPLELIINNDGTFLSQLTWIGFMALITMNIALYLVVILITLGLSANSITRERDSNTWDVLLLTNIDARQIIWGKWWASLQALWGDHVMVWLLRLGLVGFIVVQHYPTLNTGPFGLPPGITHVLTLTLIITALTVIDAAFTAAMGVAIPLSNFPGAVTASLVIGVRALGIGALVWLVDQMQTAFAENGPYALIGLVGIAGFLFFTWGALRVAQIIAVRGAVSPPERSV